MVGDFNDHSDDPAIRDHLRAAKSTDHIPPDSLLDTTAPIADEGKGTFVYKTSGTCSIIVIISPGLLDSAGFHWEKGSTRRIDFPELIFHPGSEKEIPKPNQSYTGNEFHPTGYSDHLPVGCVIVQ